MDETGSGGGNRDSSKLHRPVKSVKKVAKVSLVRNRETFFFVRMYYCVYSLIIIMIIDLSSLSGM